MSNSDKNEGYPFKLIHEEVSQEDTFKYGTHEKVANAMHKLISREDQSAHKCCTTGHSLDGIQHRCPPHVTRLF